jgi:hypothetical protein
VREQPEKIMKTAFSKALVAFAAAFFISLGAGALTTAKATTVYTYTGNDYTSIVDNLLPSGTYTTSMSVSVTFTLANPLAANLPVLTDITVDVLSFSFFDGRNTLTNATAVDDLFSVGTDMAGNIVLWNVAADNGDPTSIGEKAFLIETLFPGNGLDFDQALIDECVFAVAGTCTNFLFDVGSNTDHPGHWARTDLPNVPLPGALPLFASGLAGLGLLGWRRKKAAAG